MHLLAALDDVLRNSKESWVGVADLLGEELGVSLSLGLDLSWVDGHDGVELFLGELGAGPVEVLIVWDQTEWALVGWLAIEDTANHPAEDAGVLAVAWPHELALLGLAEPVDVEDNEFEWLLRKIECCPHQNETFLPLSEFSGALLDELNKHQSELFLENRAPSNAAPFLFWIMYHLVEHDICTPAELETLAENFGYDFEVILDYYPRTDCLRIDEILSPPESTAPSETLAWDSF